MADRVCLVPQLVGLGGPASFQSRLTAGLAARGIEVACSVDDPQCRVVLVTGGTRRLQDLVRARRRGLRVVQRLNGMNWIHRQQRTGLRYYLRAEGNNLLLSYIRRRLAHRIVYQSKFSMEWWERVYGPTRVPASVAYNGVDLSIFTPLGECDLPADRLRLLLVEGHLGGGNEQGLRNALSLLGLLREERGLPVELQVVGDVPESLRRQAAAHLSPAAADAILWRGVIPRDKIPAVDRSAHLLFSADLNAACPNAVLEALACGLPVVSFATGALPELVSGGAGRVVPYGSDHWTLQPPVLAPLVDAAADILAHQPAYRLAARARAEAAFGLEQMVDGYLEALFG